MSELENKKSDFSKKEENELRFWKENEIFEKTLSKDSPRGEFVFFEGPPTANGKPGIHHLEARAFKDAILRYKTMQGYYVRRKGGWDTHGLPVELQVEKELGLKSKKEIEEYGIERFNQKCKESVWQYVDLWKKFTDRIGFWIDLYDPYITYEAGYVESVWNIIKRVDERGLLYKDYKVLPWCPRCGTALSSHELAQGYSIAKDLSLTVKFQITSTKSQTNSKFQIPNDKPIYLLAWTTTPWTLPGNVALAVNKDVVYGKFQITSTKSQTDLKSPNVPNNEIFIVAKERAKDVLKDFEYEIVEEFEGKELVGLEYEPVFPYLKDVLEKGKGESGSASDPRPSAFKVYGADFVNTDDGTGIVHTAVMYGQDDFELGTKVGLPKYHLVNEDGTYKKEVSDFAGMFVKDESTDVAIIKDLAHRGLLFSKQKYEHSYPFCWRCRSALIYFARDSWYIKMSALRDELITENKKINWEPDHIKEGRFGEWLSDIKDWAISRERYWGTPLPVWNCDGCGKKEIIGSFDDLRDRAGDSITKLILVRHGESEKNVKNMFSSAPNLHPLTEKGKEQATKGAKELEGQKIGALYVSPVLRAKETANYYEKELNLEAVEDDRLAEVHSGDWEEKTRDDETVVREQEEYKSLPATEFYERRRGSDGESWKMVEERMVEFLGEIIEKHKGETVVLVSHEGPLVFLVKYLRDVADTEVKDIFRMNLITGYGTPNVVHISTDRGKEFDPHRPFIDEVEFDCDCGGKMKRVKEVIDVWFDSGAMPFAQDADGHRLLTQMTPPSPKATAGCDTDKRDVRYPADFISEAVDQTRGWFYTLHAIGVLLGKGHAYKNVISLGHILDNKGKKMSKSVGNIVDPWEMTDKYGVDTLRFWMYSVNQPGEPKNFDEKTVDEVSKKVFNLLNNVVAFYKMYEGGGQPRTENQQSSENVLDRWILARLSQLNGEVSEGLDNYKLLPATRAIREFIGDLSQWYLRRSRERMKEGDNEAVDTLKFTLIELSKLMAPFTPFFAEWLYKEVGGSKESVHLEDWSETGDFDKDILDNMTEVRMIVSIAFEKRAKGNVKVRQPLGALKLNFKLPFLDAHREQLKDVIKDEVNVENVIENADMPEEILLDMEITPELEEKGAIRELVRSIQEMRKKKGLNSKDMIEVVVDTDEKGKSFLEKNKTEISKSSGISEVRYDKVEAETVEIGEMEFGIEIKT